MDLIKEIKASAEEVLSVLGEGYKENVYEEALAHELRIRNIPYERQRNFEMIYKGYKVGEGRADLILNPLWFNRKGEEIVLELKVGKKIEKSHKRQAQVYMVSLNINEGWVLSFSNKVEMEKVEKPKRGFDRSVIKPSKSRKELSKILKESAENVFNYFGTEFIYRDKGLEIFPKAIAVELRLNGIDFSTGTFPICYKFHEVDRYNFNFVFSNGEVANVCYYKDEEDIDKSLEEFKFYVDILKLRKGYLICIPSTEGERVIVTTT